MKVAVCIPIHNAGATAREVVSALQRQSPEGFDRLIIDSESTDDSTQIFSRAGFAVHSVSRRSFDHGGVRRLGVDILASADLVVFMTQDAILGDSDSLRQLVAAFADPDVGAAYGRQLPSEEATPFAAHARIFNYPSDSHIRSQIDIPRNGIKTAFISNSFAAYRRSALEAIDGFPTRCIVSEDTYVAARLLLSGWKIAYCADARVYHSHNYNCRQEFQRYFDIGVFHAREPWIRGFLGGAEGEGRRFVMSEIRYLFWQSPWLIPVVLARTVMKYLGFRVGLLEGILPCRVKRLLSMQKAFWDQDEMEGGDA